MQNLASTKGSSPTLGTADSPRGYGADFRDAGAALDLASAQVGEDSVFAKAGRFLVGFAAFSDGRTFFPWNVGKPLAHLIAIPDELVEIDLLGGAYWITTIAHSQSELATTPAIGLLDSGTVQVGDVRGDVFPAPAATASETLPCTSSDFAKDVLVCFSHIGFVGWLCPLAPKHSEASVPNIGIAPATA